MESGTQLKDGGQDVVNDGSSKEDQVVASVLQENDHTLSSEPKEDSSMGNETASTEANIEKTPSIQNEELPQQNGQPLDEKTPSSVNGETCGVASQLQEDNWTLPSDPRDESLVENGNDSTEAKQTPAMQNEELPQENGQASVDGNLIRVKAETFGVASGIQQDNQTVSSETIEESAAGNGQASTESHVGQMPPMQNGELPQQKGKAWIYEIAAGVKAEAFGVGSETGLSSAEHGPHPYVDHAESVEPLLDVKADPSLELPQKPVENAETEASVLPESTTNGDPGDLQINHNGPEEMPEPITLVAASSDVRAEKDLSDGKNDFPTPNVNGRTSVQHSFNDAFDGNESGTEEEQSTFMKELESFFRDKSMEFKPPRFYRGELNCLKLWRSVIKLGGYDKVTSYKLWRQVGESFSPPKTCTTVSWTFRIFYEKNDPVVLWSLAPIERDGDIELMHLTLINSLFRALLEYERHKVLTGELNIPVAAPSAPSVQTVASRPEPRSVKTQTPGSGRSLRDAAARAMQGWHSQRLLGNGEVSDPISKDKNSMSQKKREKQQKAPGLLKRKKPEYSDYTGSATCAKITKPELDIAIVDIGPPADWVKINVQKTKDCFEVYALVPGLLREEVRVQSDPAGCLVISGEPEHLDNPWGVTAFKKVVRLPRRIDPHQTSAVVTLHGQLFVRVAFVEPKTI